MSHREEANQGTGLSVAFDILLKAPPERLQSLTVQLGESPEESVIRILCLVVLKREAEALSKSQELKDNRLAERLLGKLPSGGRLECFRDHCNHLEEFTGETSTIVARIFKVLSDQRLCDPRLRDLAYQRALSANGQKPSSGEDLELIRLFEEAKIVCGPQVAESASPNDLKRRDPQRSPSAGSTTLVRPDQSEGAPSLPSPLQAGSLEVSLPTHLEISIPSTVPYKSVPHISGGSKATDESQANKGPEQRQSLNEPQSKSMEPAQSKAKKNPMPDAASGTVCVKLDSHTGPNQNPKPSIELKPPIPNQPNVLVPHEMHESPSADKEEEEEEEDVFYAFVILHAPEDVDLAESMRDRVEAAVGGGSRGAVFSEHFAVPGRSALRCVEDAINNSAFTFLLLTRSFNTRMLELKTNTALINAINNEHKYNTVIPLLPRQNPMPSLPMVLATIVPLQEDNRLEGKVKIAMTPAKLRRLKRIWTEEQRVKHQLERQDALKQLNQTQKQLIQECNRAKVLQMENMRLRGLLIGSEEPGDGPARPHAHSINIQNAQYIMIGNDSKMTVDSGGGVDRDEQVDGEKEEEGSFSESA
ncbi:TIR domain-containing adapter molecule 1 [Betta splendens]|uniref:TIR domain-containing adapter molecule 1 n=1 Tax=Betta splendens TaxID=158456 RepID=A0A6P7L233_BETSP|nr:TIR domain-containing adapter molecule 1 [Betta splendens]